MIAQCEYCGAPLNVTSNASTAQCNYCNKTNQVRSMQTVLPQTPAGWQPPSVWAPPPQFQFPQPSLAYRETSNGARVLILVLVSAGIVAAIAVLAGVLLMVGGTSTTVTVSSTSAPVTSPIVVTTTPQPTGGINVTTSDRMICTGGEKKLTDQKYEAVIANGDCVLTLKSCTLTGSPGIVATGNARVIVDGGEIRPASGIAVVVSGNARVELKGGAKLTGQIIEQEHGKVLR